MALRLHAITPAEAQHGLEPGVGGQPPSSGDGGAVADRTPGSKNEAGPTLIAFRDLGAVVSEQKSFVLDELGPADLEYHRLIVDATFRRAAVLPVPAGVVFRTPEVLTRWMELHYVSLTDALEFVDDRAVARVHIARADARRDEREPAADDTAAGAESLRALRRRAVAAVPLRHDSVTGRLLSVSFLVERDLWNDFLRAVDDQRDAHQHLRYDVTGPWAPYDFVRMQFGG